MTQKQIFHYASSCPRIAAVTNTRPLEAPCISKHIPDFEIQNVPFQNPRHFNCPFAIKSSTYQQRQRQRIGFPIRKTSVKQIFSRNYIFINDIFSFVVIWEMSRGHSLHSGGPCVISSHVPLTPSSRAERALRARPAAGVAVPPLSAVFSPRTKNFCCYVRI